MPISFPDPTTWMVFGTDRYAQIGTGILDVALGALALFPSTTFGDPTESRAAAYSRAFVAHGLTQPAQKDREKQMVVSIAKLYAGQTGQQQYQTNRGALGVNAFQVVQFEIMMARSGVTPRGGITATVPETPQLSSVADDLWQDTLIVWSALTALANGGITRPWPTGSARAAQMQCGPAEPLPPGGQLGWTIQFDVNPS